MRTPPCPFVVALGWLLLAGCDNSGFRPDGNAVDARQVDVAAWASGRTGFIDDVGDLNNLNAEDEAEVQRALDTLNVGERLAVATFQFGDCDGDRVVLEALLDDTSLRLWTVEVAPDYGLATGPTRCTLGLRIVTRAYAVSGDGVEDATGVTVFVAPVNPNLPGAPPLDAPIDVIDNP